MTVNLEMLLILGVLRIVTLLSTGSEKRGVLGVGSIHVAILPSCQDIKILALWLHKHDIVGWKNKKYFRGSTWVIMHHLAVILTVSL